MSNKVILTGGIGDILLNFSGLHKLVELFDNDIECHIFSHFKNAEDLLKQFSFEKIFYYYKDQEQFTYYAQTSIGKIMSSPDFIGEVEIFNETIYPKITIPPDTEKVCLGTRTAIIHPFGSDFANNFLCNIRRVCSKNMTKKFTTGICRYIRQLDIVPIIVGSEKELDDYYLDDEFERFYSKNIWETFDLVNQAKFVVAADSAIKSYAGITKKPTIVFVGNYEDEQRDSKFIRPYESDIFKPIRYIDYDENIFSQTLKIIHGWGYGQ